MVTSDNHDGRFLAGGQVGADYQLAATGCSASKASTAGSATTTTGWFSPAVSCTSTTRAIASVTGRVGFAWGPALLYAKGGYAYSDNRET